MPRQVTYTCAACGRTKQASNHWFVVVDRFVNHPFHLTTWAKIERDGRLDEDGVEFVCGQQCAHKLLDEFLEESSKIIVDNPPVKE